jgi:two-component system LytT family response regulator
MRSLIIDDEHPAILGLSAQLQRVAPEVEVLGSASSVEEALTLIPKTLPELVFLDIMLVDGTGFDLLDRLEEVNFNIIFTTAYDEYAVKAFRFSAVDYLLKPISSDELVAALGRMPENDVTAAAERVKRIVENRLLAAENRKMAIPEASGIRFVMLGDILRVEADSNCSILHLADGKTIVSTRGLRNYEELLADMGFFRCHKSFIVNLRHITRYNKGKQPSIEMTDKSTVPVARNSRDKLLELLKGWTL